MLKEKPRKDSPWKNYISNGGIVGGLGGIGVAEEGCDCFEGKDIFPMTLKTYHRCRLLFSSLIKPLLGPSNGIWCFNKVLFCSLLLYSFLEDVHTTVNMFISKMYLLLATSCLINLSRVSGGWALCTPFLFFFKLFPDTIFLVQEDTQSCPSITAVPDEPGSKG